MTATSIALVFETKDEHFVGVPAVTADVQNLLLKGSISLHFNQARLDEKFQYFLIKFLA